MGDSTNKELQKKRGIIKEAAKENERRIEQITQVLLVTIVYRH